MRHFLTIPLFVASTLSVQATTYHVATGGNDGNNGRSIATAWATPQHAADVVLAGDSVIVHTGSYQGFAAMDHSGIAAAPIVFTALGNNVLIDEPCTYNNLDGVNVENVSWVVIEGFTVNDMPRTGIRTALTDHVTIRYNSCANNFKWGILTGFAEHVVIEHNVCSGSQDEHGIYFGNSADDPIIRYNHVFDNNANGIHMNGDASLGGDGVISNAQVYGNIIHGNGAAGGSGINCDGVINSLFYNNLLYGNHASGISLYQIDGGAPSTGNRVYNNTIINASDARWCVNITDGCTGNHLLNNILINQHPFRGSIVVAADALDGFLSDHNLVVNSLSPDGDATIMDLAEWQALGYDMHSMVADAQGALFVDAANGDFHALSNDAQMVDAGTSDVGSVVNVDLEGTPRPLGDDFDIGAYEYMGSTGLEREANAPTEVRLTPIGYLFPNAMRGDVLQVFDARGALVLTHAVSFTPFSITFEELPAGAGFFRMMAHDGTPKSSGVLLR
ncbi:MAG: right-handed parallel beta-helix repeat-containing protein [Flavobacteriales bacterium]